MNGEIYLKLSHHPAVKITKDYFTVGVGETYDLCVGSGADRISFSLQRTAGALTLLPGEEKLLLNGKSVKRPTQLVALDQLVWGPNRAVLLEEAPESSLKPTRDPKVGYDVLKQLGENLNNDLALSACLQAALESMVEMAGAEAGTFVTEMGQNGSWRVLASVGVPLVGRSPLENPRVLLSDTILNTAIRERRTIYVESVVGHPLGSQASILDAQIYSLACIPLGLNDRIFGAVYLSTRSVGKSIRSERLDELKTVATQVGLLLGYQTEVRKNRRQIEAYESLRPTSPKPLVYDASDSTGAMTRLMARLEKLAQSDLCLLIRGETGTGKELIAREIHRQSSRASGPFIAVNCAAIPQGLLESTLFGHVKGAFTGALKDHMGKFMQADGGTLFLDEIGEIPSELQAKLLRVIQEKEVEPVGADRTRRIDFRLIAATHTDLEAAIRDGEFRNDLYYRINGATLEVPPLRQRKSEVALLANHFLKKAYPESSFTPEAMERLLAHPWPGNVRELEQAVLRAAALSFGLEVQADDFELGAATPFPPGDAEEYEDSKTLRDFQLGTTKRYIEKVLNKYQGNRSKAAAHLGISERTLYRMLASDISGILE